MTAVMILGSVALDYDEPATEPCDEPTLVIAEASGVSANASNNTGMFTAHAGATNVTVLKNGSAYSNFTFDATSGNIVVNYTGLNEGATVFTIKATNDCGNTEGTYTINYTEPCVDPNLCFCGRIFFFHDRKWNNHCDKCSDSSCYFSVGNTKRK